MEFQPPHNLMGALRRSCLVIVDGHISVSLLDMVTIRAFPFVTLANLQLTNKLHVEDTPCQ